MKKEIPNIFEKLMMVLTLILLLSCEKAETEKTHILDNPSFEYISDNWYPPFELSMDEIWSMQGINRAGTNYYMLPKPTSPYLCSSRFIPTTNYFQSWTGLYTIEDNENGTYAIQNGELNGEKIIALSIADQNAWLMSLGLNNPEVSIDNSVDISITEKEIDSKKGWKLTGRLISNADVGKNNPNDNEDLLNIPSECWNEKVDSYQQVYLNLMGYVWYTPETKELNVAYSNTCEFVDIDNVAYNNNSIISEQDSMLKAITVYDD